jgi:hypothetical protein
MERDILQQSDLLKQIARNTKPKDSFQLIFSGNNSEFTIRNEAPIKLDRHSRYEVALVNLETYYRFPNVDATNNLFRYSPDDGRTWYDLLIPEGCYEIDDISKSKTQYMKQPNHYDAARNKAFISLSANPSTLKSVMEITGRYNVDFRPPTSLRSVLGFKNRVYHAGFNESENIVNILAMNSIFVKLILLMGVTSMVSLAPSFIRSSPILSPGYNIVENPIKSVLLPVNTHSIDNITVRLTNQGGKLLKFQGEAITIRLHIHEV